MSQPPLKISVITAVWNSVDTVSDCLQSVAAQVHRNIEHVVVDGASSDGTMEVLEQHRHNINVLVSEPDEGIYDALNKGTRLATGDVVGFLHADDVFFDETVLARVADAFTNPAVSAVYGDLEYVHRKDMCRVVRRWRAGEFTPRKLSWGWMPPHPTLYVRREWYERIGGFDTRFRIAADYLSMLKLFSQPGFCPIYLPAMMVRMRLGGASNRSIGNILRKSREDYTALRLTGIGGSGALVWKNLSKVGQLLR